MNVFGLEQNYVCIQQRDDIVQTFKYHFSFLFKIKLYQSGADSYLIQILKWTLELSEFIEANSLLFRAVFFNPSDVFFKLGLSRGRKQPKKNEGVQ